MMALSSFLWLPLFPFVTFVIARLSNDLFHLWPSLTTGVLIGLVWLLLSLATRDRLH